MERNEKYNCFLYLLKIACGHQEKAAPAGLKRLVRECICELPDLDQSVIFLHFWKSYDFAQIAHELKLSKKQAREAYTRGLNKLRNLIIRGLDAISEQDGSSAPTKALEPVFAI